MVTALTYSPVPFSAIWDVTETAVETSLRMADAEKARSRSRPDEAPIKTTEAQRQYSKVAFAVAAYATCSASMLIVNKLCITYLPAPTVVLFLQLSFTAVAIRAMTHYGIVDADPLDVEKAKPFVLVALAFLGALYTNVKTLQYANVETFIVFRCSTPCLIAVLDYVFLGRAMPNLKSWASLGAIVCGAVTYVSFDADFEVRAYGWVLAWYVVFAFDQIYIKYAVDQSSLSVWGRTYYMNALAVVPVSVMGLLSGEKFSPTLFIGLGGAGSRVVNLLAGKLRMHPSWKRLSELTHFAVVDTNKDDLYKNSNIPPDSRFLISAFD